MLINLLEIPEEGKSFFCDNSTGELNSVLADIIGKIAFKTEFIIKPQTAGTFELSGFIKTELPDQCSRCGLDFNLPVDELFKELLMPELEQPRNSKYSKVNHFSDLKVDAVSVVEYQGHSFNVGEYLHEVVALSHPFIPAPAVNDKGDCSLCLINLKEKNFNYDEDFETPESPFSSLKGIKLN